MLHAHGSAATRTTQSAGYSILILYYMPYINYIIIQYKIIAAFYDSGRRSYGCEATAANRTKLLICSRGLSNINWALVVGITGAVLCVVNKKANGALWLKRFSCSRYTELAIEMLPLTPGRIFF